mgnify:FL=1
MGLFKRDLNRSGFDGYDEFVPENLPAPGPNVEEHEDLTDDDHIEVHQIARDVFERRGVYDSTFGYNLAKPTWTAAIRTRVFATPGTGRFSSRSSRRRRRSARRVRC